MIIQAHFSNAQTGLGYQFFEADGTLLGSRITSGINSLPAAGAYAADATVPAGAVGVYWDSNEGEATEDLRDALALESLATAVAALVEPDNSGIAAIKAKTDNLPAAPAATGDVPTASSIRAEIDSNSTQLAAILADTGTDIPALIAALNDYDGSDPAGVTTLLSRLTSTRAGYLDAAISSRNAIAPLDSTATQAATAAALTAYDPPTRAEATADKDEILAAASASGDPWATVLPGAYDDGTAGAAVGRLNNTPAVAPVVVLPDPSEDSDLCVVYFDTEKGNGEKTEGLEVTFFLVGDLPQQTLSGRTVENVEISALTDSDGRIAVSLERGLTWRAECRPLFDRSGLPFTVPDQAQFDPTS